MKQLEPDALRQLASGAPEAYRIAADWLLEHDAERGESILDELQLAGRPNPSTRRVLLRRRSERDSTLRPRLEAPLRALGATDCDFHLGFVRAVRLPEAALPALPQLLALEPITELRVDVRDGVLLARAMASDVFAQLRSLTLRGRAVLSTPAPKVEQLTLRLDPGTVERVCELFPNLKRLDANKGREGAAAVEAVAARRLQLVHLWVPDTSVTAGAVTLLARSDSKLQSLSVAFNGLPVGALRELGASQSLAALRELDVRGWQAHQGFLTDRGLPALKKLRTTRAGPKDQALYRRRGINLY